MMEHSEKTRRTKSSNIAFIITLLTILIGFGLITLGVVSFSANLTVFIAIAAAVYFITLIKPLYGLAATIVAFCISSDIYVGGLPLRLEDFMIPALAICWFLQNLNIGDKFTPSPLKKPFLAMAVVGLVSTILGLILKLVALNAAMLFYFKSMEYLILFFVAINIMKTREDVKYMFITLIIASAFVGVWGTWQALMFGKSSGFRVTGPDGETSNILGGFYVFCILMAAGIFFTTKNLKLKMALMFYFGAIMFWPLIETLSRASIVSLLLALSILGFLTKQKILVWVALVMIAIPLLVPEDVFDRLRTVLGVVGIGGEEMPTSWKDKLIGWEALISTRLFKYPLLGTGVGSVNLQIDNEYMKIIGETGLIGLIVFIWMIKICYQMTWDLYKKSESRSILDQGIALGFLGAMTALLIQGLSGTVFTTMRTMQPFVIVAAMVSVLLHITNKEEWEMRRSGSTTYIKDDQDDLKGTIVEIFRRRYRNNI